MNILKNKEVKMAIGILAVLLIVFAAVVMYIFQNYTRTLNKAQLQQNIAVIGAVAKQYPQAEPEIVKIFTRDFQGDYQFGKSLLTKYNYNENLSIEKNTLDAKELWLTNIKFQMLICIFAVFLVTFFILSFNRIYSKIRRVSQGAEAVVEGDYQPIEGDREEGDLGFLIYQFNLMTGRLSENVQALKNEKLFLKRIITDISHQLKTPLAALIMFNDILKNDSTISEEERIIFVNESKNQLDRMEWLIKNMLKMAKLEAGVVEFDKQESPIAQTVHKSITGLKYIAEERNIALRITGDENIYIKHDISWTTEALSNIIKNCIEHSCTGDEINISWEENNVFVQVEIRDNGLGISKEELPRIFDRFYKGPNSRNPTNIGIGLYITKTIIEGQGGSVYAFSQPGKGTKFTVRLMKIS
ncbi:MAG: signal transduction histidine kinase [Eubacterium sp.]|jgi:signal transduction histidine kinase|nr:signal transduction histidine kinase [Eubacterium sp.]